MRIDKVDVDKFILETTGEVLQEGDKLSLEDHVDCEGEYPQQLVNVHTAMIDFLGMSETAEIYAEDKVLTIVYEKDDIVKINAILYANSAYAMHFVLKKHGYDVIEDVTKAISNGMDIPTEARNLVEAPDKIDALDLMLEYNVEDFTTWLEENFERISDEFAGFLPQEYFIVDVPDESVIVLP
jgi:hypothetical protein